MKDTNQRIEELMSVFNQMHYSAGTYFSENNTEDLEPLLCFSIDGSIIEDSQTPVTYSFYLGNEQLTEEIAHEKINELFIIELNRCLFGVA